jgi:hypothetical protein
LPSLLIAAGLLFISLVIVNRMKKPSLLGKNPAWALLACAVLLLVIGVVLHFKEPAAAARPGLYRSPFSGDRISRGRAVREAAKARVPAGWGFSFEPRSVRWGQEVQIRVTPPREAVTVYYNGRPLPAHARGEGTFVVTIPPMSKSGCFTLDSGGTQVEAEDRLVVSAH